MCACGNAGGTLGVHRRAVHGQNGVGAGPTAGLVGGLRLGDEGGGVWGSMARELALASSLCISPTGTLWLRC
jgi:hypothetical protein